MRKFLLFVWLLLPAAALAYHYGPGQEQLRCDAASEAIARAQAFAFQARELQNEQGDEAAKPLWSQAEAACGEALALVPPDRTADVRSLRLERAKAQMYTGQLPDARREFEALVEELSADPKAAKTEVRDAREGLAQSQYYMTWLMRLEGSPRTDWEPEIEAARQNYKLLAEDAVAMNDSGSAERSREDLESAVKLERMELKDLQGLPLPSQ
ncbi:MAG: hypothetical protein IPJ19_16290 [Planctomycetes bacterium]|nr:hypothetical protein [Planctomycetota bacterium]